MSLSAGTYNTVMKEPTKTQRLYIQLLVDGYSQKQIAAKLGKSRKTIEVCLHKVRRNFGLQSNYQVVALAVSWGWVNVQSNNK